MIIKRDNNIYLSTSRQSTHVSQARLSTGRVAKVQSERIVRDKKYYEEVLRVKINQLNAELDSLNAYMDQAAKDMGSHHYFKAIVKELAASLTGKSHLSIAIFHRLNPTYLKSPCQQCQNKVPSVLILKPLTRFTVAWAYRIITLTENSLNSSTVIVAESNHLTS